MSVTTAIITLIVVIRVYHCILSPSLPAPFLSSLSPCLPSHLPLTIPFSWPFYFAISFLFPSFPFFHFFLSDSLPLSPTLFFFPFLIKFLLKSIYASSQYFFSLYPSLSPLHEILLLFPTPLPSVNPPFYLFSKSSTIHSH